MKKDKKPWSNGKLTISGNNRYLLNGSTPFFWLGDTAWTMLQRLDKQQTYIYLKNRHDKGFNVIQSVLINYWQPGNPGSNLRVDGEDILQCIDKKNETYWQHVEDVLAMAEEFGMYMGFLPVWGGMAKKGYINENNAAQYARYIGHRFKTHKNIIWILGGDIRGSEHFEMWNIIATELKEINPERMIGYHPFGRTSSSYWFNNCSWLDMNMFQSGHRRYDQNTLQSWDDAASAEPWYGEDNWRYVQADMDKTPMRPVLDAEPSYELIPQGLHDASQPYWQAHHVRRYAYWSVLAGACGHTYGDNSIFQFYGTGFAPVFGVIDPWDIAIHHEGSGQMMYLKDLMLEIDFTKGHSMQQLLLGKEGKKEERISIFGTDKAVVVYDYSGREFVLYSENAVYSTMDAWWMDPATGIRSYLGTVDLAKRITFSPPVKMSGQNDWVLLLK